MIEIKLRNVFEVLVGLCAGYTVNQIVKNNTDPETKLQKAEIYVGGFVLGLMACESAERYVEKMIDYHEVRQIARANDLS